MKKHDTFTKMSPDEFLTQVIPIFIEVFNYPGSFLEVFREKLSFRIVDVHFGLLPAKEIFDALRQIGLKDGYDVCPQEPINHSTANPPD